VTQHKNVSEDTARRIDEVVREVIDRAHDRAREILTTNMSKLEAMAGALLQYETIDREQIADIMAGKAPRAPKAWQAESSSSGPGAGGSRPAEKPIGGPAAQTRQAEPPR
jgi:cell division protease FtsH